MKNRIRWLTLALFCVFCMTILVGCGKNQEEFCLSVALGADPDTLDPALATGTTAETVIAQVYENLMTVRSSPNEKPIVQKGMAKSVDTQENGDGTITLTFKLRNAKWSDGKAVRADDFVFAWQRLIDPKTDSPHAPLLSTVQGYKAVRSTGDVTQLAVTANDDKTLTVVLNGTCPWFITDVCTAPATMPLRRDFFEVAEEEDGEEILDWTADREALITNGVYEIGGYTAGEQLFLEPNYRYNGECGPTALTIRFTDSPANAYALYQDGEVDFVSPVPDEVLKDLIKQEEDPTIKRYSTAPNLSVDTLIFNTAKVPFDDIRMRQAFALAIDRQVICELQGVSSLPASGLVPIGVVGEEDAGFRTAGECLIDDSEEANSEQIKQAKGLVEQAGYDGGVPVPTVEFLYVDEGTNGAVADALVKMWKDSLDITVLPKGVSETEMETAKKSHSFTLALTRMVGFANDAESFLTNWMTGSDSNWVQYSNSAYDTLISVIDSASDTVARQGCLHDAEQLLLEKAPLMPLTFSKTGWLLQPELSGVCREARGWFCFRDVASKNS